MLQIMTNMSMTLPILANGLKLMRTSWSGMLDSIILAATQIQVRNGIIIA